MSVFITEANLGSSVNVMRSLGNKGITISAGDVSKITGGFSSKYCNKRMIYYDPKYEKKYVQSISNFHDKHKFDVIFAMSDRTIKPLVKYKEYFETKNIVVPTPNYDVFSIMCDKYKTYSLANSNKVPCPKTYQIESHGELIEYSKDLNYPIVIKPSDLTGGRGIFYTKNISELEYCYNYIKKTTSHNPLIQEYIPGKRQILSVPMIFNRNGKLVAACVLRKIRESPITGGAATAASSERSDEIIKIALKLFRGIKWFGIVTPEFKIDNRDNIPKLMEVNPRFFGYLKLAISSGLDLPYILYQIVNENKELPFQSINKKMYFSRFIHDLKTFFNELTTFKDKKEVLLNFLNTYSRTNITFDYLSCDDLNPFVFSLICTLGQKLNLLEKPFEEIE